MLLDTPTRCDNREQALLVAIASEARRVVLAKGGQVSRNVLLKGFCYAKLCGMKTPYRFDIYPSGPYCEMVLRDIDWLEQDQALENYAADNGQGADYIIGAGSMSLCTRYRDYIESERERVRAVLLAMAPLTKAHLTTVARVHFAWLCWTAAAADPQEGEAAFDLRLQVIREVLAAEDNLESPETVANTFDQLAALGIVAAHYPRNDEPTEDTGNGLSRREELEPSGLGAPVGAGGEPEL